jgi:hypothetical protein
VNVDGSSSEAIAIELAIQMLKDAHQSMMSGYVDPVLPLVQIVRQRLEKLEAELQSCSASIRGK